MPHCFSGCANICWTHGVVESKMIEGKEEAGAKFADYFDYSETIDTIPSHRALALFRGRREEMLNCRAAPGFGSGKAEVGRAAQPVRSAHRRTLRHP